MNENSIEFSLSNSEQRDSWLNSGHRTLDADKCRSTYTCFDLIIDQFVSGLFSFSGAELKVDFISAVFAEEGFNGKGQQDDHVLKGIDFGLQDLLCSGNGIGDDSSVVNIVYFHGRNKSCVNSHNFSLERYDVYRVNLQLFNDQVVGPDMSSCCSNMRFFDATICNDSYTVVVYLRRPEGKIEALKVLVKVLIIRRRMRMITNSTREIIDYPRVRDEERVKEVKAISNTIKTLIDILDRTLEIGLLFHAEFESSNSMRGLILGMV